MTTPDEREAVIAEMREHVRDMREGTRSDFYDLDAVPAIIERWIAALTREQREGVVSLPVTTRHPQDYVLHNELDGTKYRGTVEGRWKKEPQQEAPGAVAWTHDAETWGNALNDAGWEFIEHYPEKSALLFASAKPALRMAILKYAASVQATTPPAPVDVRGVQTVIENLNNATAVLRDKRTEAGPNRAWLTEQVNLLRAALLDGQQAGDGVVVPAKTLRWWRELTTLNPKDLVPRIDAMIAAAPSAKGVA